MSLIRLILSFKALLIFGEEHIKSRTLYLLPYLLFLSSPYPPLSRAYILSTALGCQTPSCSALP